MRAGSVKMEVPKPPEKYRPTVLRPPEQMAFLAVSFNGQTLWYAGPANGIEQRTVGDMELFGMYTYTSPRQEVVIHGFEPFAGGHEPLKSIKWPEPPPPPKPRQLTDYSDDELLEALARAIRNVEDLKDDEECTSTEDERAVVQKINDEIKRRLVAAAALKTQSIRVKRRLKNAKKARSGRRV